MEDWHKVKRKRKKPVAKKKKSGLGKTVFRGGDYGFVDALTDEKESGKRKENRKVRGKDNNDRRGGGSC